MAVISCRASYVDKWFFNNERIFHSRFGITLTKNRTRLVIAFVTKSNMGLYECMGYRPVYGVFYAVSYLNVLLEPKDSRELETDANERDSPELEKNPSEQDSFTSEEYSSEEESDENETSGSGDSSEGEETIYEQDSPESENNVNEQDSPEIENNVNEQDSSENEYVIRESPEYNENDHIPGSPNNEEEYRNNPDEIEDVVSKKLQHTHRKNIYFDTLVICLAQNDE